MYVSSNKDVKLGIWLSQVDENLTAGPLHVVKDKGEKLAKKIKIKDVSKLKEFIGCKIEIEILERSAKFIQPVMIQFFMKFVQEKRSELHQQTKHSSKRPEPGEILNLKLW